MPQGVPNTWWRSNEGERLIHFCCAVCYQERTIPRAWEVASIPELYRRAQFSNTNLIICDPCWPIVRSKTVETFVNYKAPDPEAVKIVPPEGHDRKLEPGFFLPGIHA